MKILEGKKEEFWLRNLSNDAIVRNFQNMQKGMDIHPQEVHKALNRHNQKDSELQHIIVKLSQAQFKERSLRFTRAKFQITFEANYYNNRYHSADILLARKE